jgi:hypothetical protein
MGDGDEMGLVTGVMEMGHVTRVMEMRWGM